MKTKRIKLKKARPQNQERQFFIRCGLLLQNHCIYSAKSPWIPRVLRVGRLASKRTDELQWFFTEESIEFLEVELVNPWKRQTFQACIHVCVSRSLLLIHVLSWSHDKQSKYSPGLNLIPHSEHHAVIASPQANRSKTTTRSLSMHPESPEKVDRTWRERGECTVVLQSTRRKSFWIYIWPGTLGSGNSACSYSLCEF